NVQPDDNEQRTGEKWDTPGPREELLLRESLREQQENARGDDEADRRPQLREHPEPRVAPGRRILGREQHRPSPLTAEPEALTESAQGEQRRSPQPDGRIAGQQANRDRREAHGEQRRDERRLASDAIAKVTEHSRADRPRQESQRESCERLQRRGS